MVAASICVSHARGQAAFRIPYPLLKGARRLEARHTAASSSARGEKRARLQVATSHARSPSYVPATRSLLVEH